MTLAKYHEKRSFARTPEPRGKKERHAAKGLRFVVQKHDASHLHYDFRLEMEGVMKSWAIPKGPSLDPADKRLAMMTEDHPLSYRTFEGSIPEGNYGAGTVIVWDEGTYYAADTTDTAEGERTLLEGLAKGHLSFVLEGQKLRGEYSLRRMPRAGENAWLLVKKRDADADERDITEEDRSVRSDRTLSDIKKGADVSPRTAKKTVPKSGSAGLEGHPAGKGGSMGGTPSGGPSMIRPMLATLVDEPFDRKGWIFEIKWDGYRAVADTRDGEVRLYSRNKLSFNDRYPAVAEAVGALAHDCILDGEITVMDEHGRSDFQLLQNHGRRPAALRYCVFDLLELDGHDLRDLPLRERKELLRKLIPAGDPVLLYSDDVREKGKAFFAAAKKQGVEGIMAKDASSPYREGSRSEAWLKIKTHLRQEAVIGGFTAPRKTRERFGALVLGVYADGELEYVGHAGGGFDRESLRETHAKLLPLVRNTSPFTHPPKTNEPVTWVEPELVCEVSFQEWTADGIMRQPIFHGLRVDKPAEDVRREDAVSAPETVLLEEAEARAKPKKKTPAERAHERKPDVPTLTHLDKVYWPEEGYTKGDLIAYYTEMADTILPYLRDRPLSLHRFPSGITEDGFWEKDVGDRMPPWVQVREIRLETEKRVIRSALCQDQATLLYLANLGCIEMNPWNARVGTPDHPDYLVIDLDPEDIPFAEVIRTAQTVHEVLEKAGAEGYPKTSGKTGIHILVPLGARYTFEQARRFGELIVAYVHHELPDTTSLERSPRKRQKRVYLDYLQNNKAQTIAAPYGVRPWPGATVSAPLRWEEVKAGLDPADFTIKTMPKRLRKLGDLWKPVLGDGIDMAACLERLEKP
jgi:bifunctional non-homologous end joining protein LigD